MLCCALRGFCADSSAHRWERVSQLAWSACWAQRCIWSPQGCPWKTHTYCEHTHSKAGATPSPTCTRRLLLACTLLNGTYHSHTRRLLSSDVLTNRRFSSTKVMVLTAPRWRSYSCTTSPVLTSHWKTELNSKVWIKQTRVKKKKGLKVAAGRGKRGTCVWPCTENTSKHRRHQNSLACWQQRESCTFIQTVLH